MAPNRSTAEPAIGMNASPARPVTVSTRPTRAKERPVTWWKKTSENGTYMPIPIALMPTPTSSDHSPETRSAIDSPEVPK